MDITKLIPGVKIRQRDTLKQGEIYSHLISGHLEFYVADTYNYKDSDNLRCYLFTKESDKIVCHTCRDSMVYVFPLYEAKRIKNIAELPDWMLEYVRWDFQYEYV